MPDIAMCDNSQCPQRATCHRFTAIASYRQSYFVGCAPDAQTGECKHYWPVNTAHAIRSAQSWIESARAQIRNPRTTADEMRIAQHDLEAAHDALARIKNALPAQESETL
jgi:trans-aconitate methyltransferase